MQEVFIPFPTTLLQSIQSLVKMPDKQLRILLSIIGWLLQENNFVIIKDRVQIGRVEVKGVSGPAISSSHSKNELKQ